MKRRKGIHFRIYYFFINPIVVRKEF